MSEDCNITWWPPKAGDKLRHDSLHSAGDMRVKRVEALLHVLAVYPHDDAVLITTAEWLPGRRRWLYQVWDVYAALYGTVWPDGVEKPVWPKPRTQLSSPSPP